MYTFFSRFLHSKALRSAALLLLALAWISGCGVIYVEVKKDPEHKQDIPKSIAAKQVGEKWGSDFISADETAITYRVTIIDREWNDNYNYSGRQTTWVHHAEYHYETRYFKFSEVWSVRTRGVKGVSGGFFYEVAAFRKNDDKLYGWHWGGRENKSEAIDKFLSSLLSLCDNVK